MLRRAGEFMEEQAGDELLLLDLTNGLLHRLNATAALVWELTENGGEMSEIVEFYKNHFSLSPHQAEQDVSAIVRQFAEAGLLVEA